MLKKIKTVLSFLIDDIAGFFPYFLTFYIIALILSAFSESWRLFFYWSAFHATFILLGLASLLSKRGNRLLENLARNILTEERKGQAKKGGRFFIKTNQVFLSIFLILLKYIISITIRKLKKTSFSDYLKLAIIILVLVIAFYLDIKVLNFFVLFYALVSILFLLDSRLSASITLILLFFCLIFLICKKADITESIAVYVFYFLIVTVLTQIEEYQKQKPPRHI